MRYLVKRAQNNDDDAFVKLMEMHKESMYKVARSYLINDADAADAMQETVLKCYEKLPTLKQPKYFKTWMIRILINCCNDILQKSKNIFSLSNYEEMNIPAPEQDLTEFLQVLESIDEKYRTVIILYYVEGYKVKEIAEILELNEHTVNSQLQRGRIRLRKELNGERSGVVG